MLLLWQKHFLLFQFYLSSGPFLFKMTTFKQIPYLLYILDPYRDLFFRVTVCLDYMTKLYYVILLSYTCSVAMHIAHLWV